MHRFSTDADCAWRYGVDLQTADETAVEWVEKMRLIDALRVPGESLAFSANVRALLELVHVRRGQFYEVDRTAAGFYCRAADLADFLGKSERSTRRIIAQARELGVLKVGRPDQWKANRYEIDFEAVEGFVHRSA